MIFARCSGRTLIMSQRKATVTTQTAMPMERCVLDCETMKVSTRLE